MPDYVVVEDDYRIYLGCRIEDENENQIDSEDENENQIDSEDVNVLNYLDKVDWQSDDYEDAYYDM